MLNRRADKLELLRIAEAVALEKSIDKELIISSMETGIAKAAKSKFGSDNEIKVEIVRGNVEELLTVYASRLSPEALQEFGTMMRSSFKDAFDRGYDVFKNNKGDLKLAKNYRPTQKVLEDTAKSFMDDVVTKSEGKFKLTKQEAMTMADEIWDSTELAKSSYYMERIWRNGQIFQWLGLGWRR